MKKIIRPALVCLEEVNICPALIKCFCSYQKSIDYTTLPSLRFLLSIIVCTLASQVTSNIVLLVTPQMQIASCTPCGPMFNE